MNQFWSFEKLADYDYGVKGFEIRFQRMIEDYLMNHGISEPWYKYYRTSLFMQILEIYDQNITVIGENVDINVEVILKELHHLYDQVVKEVSLNVEKTLEERKKN